MSILIAKPRYQILDFTRGIAVGLMFIYHFCFGLGQMGWIQFDAQNDWYWQALRFLIVFLFLTLVGIGMFLATQEKLNRYSYLKRLSLLAIYMFLITLVSKIVRPSNYVYFGILHLIFVSSLFGLLFIKLYRTNLFLGLILIVFGYSLSAKIFDHPSLQWIGFTTTKPVADDYAPIIPWFGLVLIGLFIGRFLFEKNKNPHNVFLWKAMNRGSRLFCWAGRHSIHLYFIHFQFFYLIVFLLQ